MLGKLYVVATPIGNLEDLSLRVLKVLSDVDIVLAEDTRVTQKLLSFVKTKFRIEGEKALSRTQNSGSQRLISYHQHSSEKKKLEILSYLMNGSDTALVTDAGTPGISDPGNELIEFLTSKTSDLQVIPIPGPSAVSTALSICGFDTSKFCFIGFWPKKKVGRAIKLTKLWKGLVVFYESPYRILKTLTLLKDELGGEKHVFVARELTKLHETLYRGSINEVAEKLQKGSIKGEIVVVLES